MYSEISTVEGSRILIRGLDVADELIGYVTFTDMVMLTIVGRLPNARERKMLDAVLVSLVDHGVTPSSLTARLTYNAAPEAVQAAVAAGLLNSGSRVLGSMEDCARSLLENLPAEVEDHVLAAAAERIIGTLRGKDARFPGIGHTTHSTEDPRATRLLEIASELGFKGPYVRLLQHIRTAASNAAGKQLSINVTGAIGAVLLELGIQVEATRGFGLISRIVALVAHVAEESRTRTVAAVLRQMQDEAAK